LGQRRAASQVLERAIRAGSAEARDMLTSIEEEPADGGVRPSPDPPS
jgi:hypothetical protein